MKKLIFFLLICSGSIIFSQTERLKVVEVLDANLFQLSNGKYIKMACISAPSILDTNAFISEVAEDAVEFAKIYIKERYFELKIDTLSEKNVSEQNLIIDKFLSEKDFQEEYLVRGYGIINKCCKKEDLTKYIVFQNEAKEEENGIWENLEIAEQILLQEHDESNINKIIMLRMNQNKEESVVNERFVNSIAGILIGGAVGAAVQRIIKNEKTYWGLRNESSNVGAYIGMGVGLLVFPIIFSTDNDDTSTALPCAENFDNLSHQDIYNSSKLFEMNVLRINF